METGAWLIAAEVKRVTSLAVVARVRVVARTATNEPGISLNERSPILHVSYVNKDEDSLFCQSIIFIIPVLNNEHGLKILFAREYAPLTFPAPNTYWLKYIDTRNSRMRLCEAPGLKEK